MISLGSHQNIGLHTGARANVVKIVADWGSTSDPTGGVYSTPLNPQAVMCWDRDLVPPTWHSALPFSKVPHTLFTSDDGGWTLLKLITVLRFCRNFICDYLKCSIFKLSKKFGK